MLLKTAKHHPKTNHSTKHNTEHQPPIPQKKTPMLLSKTEHTTTNHQIPRIQRNTYYTHTTKNNIPQKNENIPLHTGMSWFFLQCFDHLCDADAYVLTTCESQARVSWQRVRRNVWCALCVCLSVRVLRCVLLCAQGSWCLCVCVEVRVGVCVCSGCVCVC